MELKTILTLAVPLLYFALLVLEPFFAGRSFPEILGWHRLGGVFFLATLAVGALTPILLPLDWFESHRLLDLSALGGWGIPIGLLTASFFGYWLHRAEHRFDWLWRASHQLHHSPTRVDMWGAFYSHPLEVAMKVALGATVSTLLLGLAPLAASAVGLISAALSMFQHLNINTPHWLGYLVQRPESHCLHHERNVHARNYSDLPLWDIVFGTFHNPSSFTGKVGFREELSQRIGSMLLMQDVHKAAKAVPS